MAIRMADAGSCNGCEFEMQELNNSFYDIERFGIHFVASPRHADLLLVTGPVSRHMQAALKGTYDATPDPKLVSFTNIGLRSSGQIFAVHLKHSMQAKSSIFQCKFNTVHSSQESVFFLYRNDMKLPS
jgi:Ni,Fe-hydrogenase III small subunit